MQIELCAYDSSLNVYSFKNLVVWLCLKFHSKINNYKNTHTSIYNIYII